MIVTRLSFEYPNATGKGISSARERARTLLKNIAATATSNDRADTVEQMSLSELLYFALLDQNAMA